MGAIVEAHQAYRQALMRGEDHQRAERQVISEALTAMATALELPVYETDDSEEALIHHMRREAFSDWFSPDGAQPYISLGARLEEQSSGEEPTPVLLGYKVDPENNNGSVATAFIAVGPEQPAFRSSVEHTSDVEESGFTGKVATTRRTLALIGRTARVAVDLMGFAAGDPPAIWPNTFEEGEIVLSQTYQINGRNGKAPSKEHVISRADVEIDRLHSPRYALAVGWEEVAAALGKGLGVARRAGESPVALGEGQAFQHLIRLRSFLKNIAEPSRCPEEQDTSPFNAFEALCAHSPAFRAAFKRVAGMEKDTDKIVTL